MNMRPRKPIPQPKKQQVKVDQNERKAKNIAKQREANEHQVKVDQNERKAKSIVNQREAS